eukprot:m.82502 g.82502  ORF g.82502 m.82502 type:complete len:301 (-) comp17644_c0_seq1:29-931(-)
MLKTLLYSTAERVARIVLNRPTHGNAITFEMVNELSACVERANLDPSVHVIALSGQGKLFCGGYDLKRYAETAAPTSGSAHQLSPTDEQATAANHNPAAVWDPMVDYQMMSRNVKGFMSLFNSDKPVLCKVHGACVAGGTDLALCSDILIMADNAKIGYPPARVWGVPTTAMWVPRVGLQRAKRLLFTGDLLSGKQAAEWGLALQSVPEDSLDSTFDALVQRISLMPINQLIMLKMLCNQSVHNSGHTSALQMSTVFDGVARHTKEGYAFAERAAQHGFKQAVFERDSPFDNIPNTLSKE